MLMVMASSTQGTVAAGDENAQGSPVGRPSATRADAPRRISTHQLSSSLRVAVGRLSRRIRAEKADGDISDGQFSVLALLFREGPKTLGALSAHERVTPPSMNRTVNKLEAAGYLVRQASDDDRRKVLFVPTDAGRELVTETRRRRDAWLDRRLARLPAQTRALLADAAEVMRELADS